MSLFETTIQINHQKVSQILKKNWNLELGKIIKASQNHTFQAKLVGQNSQQLFSVRVTPDPHKKNVQRIHDQISFIRYLSEHKLHHICAPIKPITSDEYYFIADDLIICVFQWARGELLSYVQFQWMKNKTIVNRWGQFFAELHHLSRNFEKENPEIAKRIQRWDQIHHSILAGTKLHPDDQKVLENPEHYGVLHGDLNCSNFFYQKTTQHLQVFDTDQVQRGLFLWDVSQAVFSVYMLQKAGMPISGTPVPQANKELFQEWIIQGYQKVSGKGSVDIQRLNRMVLLKKQFYLKFCTKAVQQGNIPADMKPFIEYIASKLGDKKE